MKININWGKLVLQIRTDLVDHDFGANVVADLGSLVVINWNKYYSKLGQVLQMRATVVSK